MMEERKTRMESHCEVIENFLESDVKSIRRRLYNREIVKLQKRYPEIKIEKISPYREQLYDCLISK